MILVTNSVLDVTPYETQGILPAVIIPREPPDAWYVRCLPLDASIPGDGWEWSLTGKELRIPMYPYLIRGTDPERAVAFGVQLGMQAMHEVAGEGGDPVVRGHLAIGYPMEDKGDHLRYWLGVAFLLRRRPGT